MGALVERASHDARREEQATHPMQFSGRPTPRLIGGIVAIALVLGVFAWMRGRDVEFENTSAPLPQKSDARSTSDLAASNVASEGARPATRGEAAPTTAPPPSRNPETPALRFDVPDPARPRRKITFVGTLLDRAVSDAGKPDFAPVIVRAPAYKVEAFPDERGEFTMLIDLPPNQTHVRIEVEWPGRIFEEVSGPPAFGTPFLMVPIDPESAETRATIPMVPTAPQ